MKTVRKLMGSRHVPILFSAPMVRELREGRKTQTRRIVKGTPLFHQRAALLSFKNGVATFGDSIPDDPVPLTVKARWSAGDTLWVRETFAILTGNGHRTVYRAAGEEPRNEPLGPMRWTPSIFMRQSQSRIRLEVERVRIERLQDISISDALAEGVNTVTQFDPRTAYAHLWDEINGKTAPWKTNPFVWVVEFVRAA